MRSGGIDFFAIQEAVVQIAQITSGFRHSNLLGQTCAQRVGAGNDDAIGNAQFEKGVAAGTDFLKEILVRYSDFAVLVAALLFVRNLIFNLQRTGASFDHFLGEQIGCLGIAETCVDIGNDGDDMRFVIFDFAHQLGFGSSISGCAGFIKIAEKDVEFAGIGLTQESVQLFNQRRNAGFFVHRLIGQGAKFAAQGSDHPAGKVEVTAFGCAKMLFDRNDFLLRDETMPAAERLCVVRRVTVIGRHVVAHDRGRVTGDVEAGLKAVLHAHTGDGFGADRVPCAVLGANDLAGGGNFVLIGHCDKSLAGRVDMVRN